MIHRRSREWHQNSHYHITQCGEKVHWKKSTSSNRKVECRQCLQMFMMKMERDLQMLKEQLEEFE